MRPQIEKLRARLGVPASMSGEELVAWRGRYGLTQIELAQFLGLAGENGKRTVRRWEKDGYAVPWSVVATLHFTGQALEELQDS